MPATTAIRSQSTLPVGVRCETYHDNWECSYRMGGHSLDSPSLCLGNHTILTRTFFDPSGLKGIRLQMHG
jgi:hypothetical protein